MTALMDDAGILALGRTLSEAALRGAPGAWLVETFCQTLQAAGLPLFRAFVGADTLHPVVEGITYEWRPARDSVSVRPYERSTAPDHESAWVKSPLYRVFIDRARLLRRTLDRTYSAGEFPIIDDLVGEGATDYVCWMMPFADRAAVAEDDGFYASLTTDRAGGFSDEEIANLDQLMSTLALAMRAVLLVRTTETLLSTYLGEDPGRRILHGQIARGATETLSAVIWFSDLRGFTRIGDTVPEALVALLNDYSDCLVTAVQENGGQVLKFIGDGLLAIFPIAADDDAGAACRRALAAADQARWQVADLNRRRTAADLPVTTFTLGLHVGDVIYGNVGSRTRLDFTVVGPAVNEVSRIAGLCRALEREAIVSHAFAGACDGGRLASLGLHALRGVRRPQELFALLPAGGALSQDVPTAAIPATK